MLSACCWDATLVASRDCERLVDFVFKEGNKGILSSAISTIDVALWDLKAKADNQPLWKTLGSSLAW